MEARNSCTDGFRSLSFLELRRRTRVVASAVTCRKMRRMSWGLSGLWAGHRMAQGAVNGRCMARRAKKREGRRSEAGKREMR